MISMFNCVLMLIAGLIGAILYKDPFIFLLGFCGSAGWLLDAAKEHRSKQ